jgi:hypothetical protein
MIPDTHRPRRGDGADAKPTEVGPQEPSADRLSDEQVRALGFEPTRRGWRPLTAEVDQRIDEAMSRIGPGSNTDPIPFRIPGTAECAVCGEDAEASTCGTPTCSWVCVSVLMEQLLPKIADHLYTRGDGSGGTAAIRPPAPPKPKLRPIHGGRPSVERALERLGDCSTVLERHGHRLRGRMVFCPFHENSRTRAMSVYERSGKSRAHCHSCDFDGDAIDLEAAISGEDVVTTIKRWGSN